MVVRGSDSWGCGTAAAPSAVVVVMSHPDADVQHPKSCDVVAEARKTVKVVQLSRQRAVVSDEGVVQIRPKVGWPTEGAAHDLVVHGNEAWPFACQQLPGNDPPDDVLVFQ